MAEHTQIAFGDRNRGVQVGLNSGSITNEFHVPPERPETPPKPCLTIPFRRDADFVNRDTLLDQIQDACSRPASRVALVGLGGVGKSQLAIEYAYRTNDVATQKSRPTWVFWIHAETRARVEEGFRALADTVKLPGRKQPDADVLQLVEQWLRGIENGPWLLILDNADNVSVLFDTERGSTSAANATVANDSRGRALWTYLPQSSHGSILITTRNEKVAEKLTGGGKSIRVQPMDKEHALTLLKKKTGNKPDMENGVALVEALEYIPLAISQAGAYIRQQAPRTPRTPIRKYLEDFQKNEQRKFSLLNRDEGDLRRDRDASNSVIVTWQISFESIRSERPSAADLLSLMSFFDRPGIPESLVRPLGYLSSKDRDTHYSESERNEEDSDIDERSDFGSESNSSSASSASEDSVGQSFEDDLQMLRSYSLISMDETGEVFEMHSLVQLATRRWLSTEERVELFRNSL
ncbi:P-loop containing nucleoside triphosphate hydrolase protein [Microdochium trichocladiopsis]|uniref:P-loop containing nucleoside triphosphate hydrolase protein n=1 Tax=Microdochium trichocladiopsis TaxID=1682393 RepID=A0A9P9BJT2_9PEZI|nr:P-loop containing nucleoside triphosphate hydrolase protein [Microdochium trichocladiopsis]KAH7016329.1 P-loop containing nucleoside triphosphate hydrolase protein [Microdochium trichocladiopsis]